MKKILLFCTFVLTFIAQAFSQSMVSVKFDPNFQGGVCSQLTVPAGHAIPLEHKVIPQREGYHFAGWFTDSQCTEDNRWTFGKKAGSGWGPAADSLAVTKDMTLYAKWAAPVHVKTAEDFNNIRQDLYGWYVLDADIDLSGYTAWEPIGNYDSSNEYADAEWWKLAFHGIIEGNNHKITGLRLTQRSGFVNSLIGALANGEIRDLTVEAPVVQLAGESIYASPFLGYMKNDASGMPIVENCHVIDADIRVSVKNPQNTFSGATALVMAGWGGVVRNSSASGNLRFEIAGLPAGGELYIGALNGECYCDMVDCSADVSISLMAADGAELNDVKAFVGGLQASATNVTSCTSKGQIAVIDHPGFSNLCVGGIAGSERYGVIQDSKSLCNILVKNQVRAHVGGIVGEFSQQYGMIGAITGHSETVISGCTAEGNLPVSGNGIPEPVGSPFGGGTMKYVVK